eukprot:6057263-Pleurochrysis_carterae.AAC.3
MEATNARVSTDDDELCAAFGRTFLCEEGTHGYSSARLMAQLLRPGSYVPDHPPQATVQQAVSVVQQHPAVSHCVWQHSFPAHEQHTIWHAQHQSYPYTTEAPWSQAQRAEALWAQAQQQATVCSNAAYQGPATAPQPTRIAYHSRSQESEMKNMRPLSKRNSASARPRPTQSNLSDCIASANGELRSSAVSIKATTDTRVTPAAGRNSRTRAPDKKSASPIHVSVVDLFASEGLATARRPAASAARGHTNRNAELQHSQQLAAEQCVGKCTTTSSSTTHTGNDQHGKGVVMTAAGQAPQLALSACMAACGPKPESAPSSSVRDDKAATHSTEPVLAMKRDNEQPVASAETAATRGASVRLVDGPHAGQRGTVTGVDDDGDVYVSLANGARCVLGRRQFDILLQSAPRETDVLQSVPTDAISVSADAKSNDSRLRYASTRAVPDTNDEAELSPELLKESLNAPASAAATSTESHDSNVLTPSHEASAGENDGASRLNSTPKSTTRWEEGEDAMMSALRLSPPSAAVDKV